MPGHDDLLGVDLPLLLALKQLLDSESVTLAARQLGTTQPSLSRTLARLRALFGDPLLVPVGRRLQATSRARALQPRLQHAIESMRLLLLPAAPFVPGEASRVVRIAASDYAAAVVLHPWIARLRREAPGVVVQLTALDPGIIDPLAYGELDLAIAPRIPVAGVDQFVFRKILDDRLVCVVSKRHPHARARLTLRGYLALAHVMIGGQVPSVSTVQVALHRLRKVRTVAARVPSFQSALALVAATELAAALPERLIGAMNAEVVARPLPFRVEPIALHLVWHPRHTTDPQHRWLRDGIAAAMTAPRARRVSARSRGRRP